MKLLTTLTLAAVLGGCSATQAALWTGNYDAAFALMQGEGTLIQQADGRQKFRYAINAKAFDDLPGDPEEARLHMLAQWVGNAQGCSKGYDIKNRYVASGTVVYEGDCR